MKREDLPPYLTEYEKDLVMAERRQCRPDRRRKRRVGARERRRGFYVPARQPDVPAPDGDESA